MARTTCTNLSHPVANSGPVVAGKGGPGVQYHELQCTVCGLSQGVRRVKAAVVDGWVVLPLDVV